MGLIRLYPDRGITSTIFAWSCPCFSKGIGSSAITFGKTRAISLQISVDVEGRHPLLKLKEYFYLSLSRVLDKSGAILTIVSQCECQFPGMVSVGDSRRGHEQIIFRI